MAILDGMATFKRPRQEFLDEFATAYGRSASLKWPWLYDILRSKGYDPEKAARISNSRAHLRKGRRNVLTADEAHNPAVLAKVKAAGGKHRTRGQLTKT